MKTLINLVIAGLLVHASWRGGTAFWRYYEFKDGVQSTAQYGGAMSTEQIRDRVREIAKELEVPVDPETIKVRRELNRTFVDAVYTDNIEILPMYFYPWQFTVNVDVFTVSTPGTEMYPGR